MTDPAPNHHADHPPPRGPAAWSVGAAMVVAHRHDARLVCDLSGVGAGDRVLDIGCGPGTAARLAARRGALVTGVDPSPTMLRLARVCSVARPGTGRVEWMAGSAESLPVGDASVAVCWSLASVHHWDDLGAALAEVHRVLRPGGSFWALEKRCEPGAQGMANHGWTDDQARRFAELLTSGGFDATEVAEHTVGRRRRVVTVTAVRT